MNMKINMKLKDIKKNISLWNENMFNYADYVWLFSSKKLSQFHLQIYLIAFLHFYTYRFISYMNKWKITNAGV